MEQLAQSILLVTDRKDGRRIIAACAAGLFVVLLVSGTMRGDMSAFPPGALILAMLGSLLAGINFALAYLYVCLREDEIREMGKESRWRLVRAFISIGGTASGTAFLSVLLGFLGFSAMLGNFSKDAQEIGYIGLMILMIAGYALSKKVTRFRVC